MKESAFAMMVHSVQFWTSLEIASFHPQILLHYIGTQSPFQAHQSIKSENVEFIVSLIHVCCALLSFRQSKSTNRETSPIETLKVITFQERRFLSDSIIIYLALEEIILDKPILTVLQKFLPYEVLLFCYRCMVIS